MNKVNKILNSYFVIRNSHSGYVAIASVLVIGAVIIIISTTTTLTTISEGQISLATKKNEESLDFVEGCVEDALLRINEDNTLSSSLTLPEGTCSVTINSQSGNNWDITVSGTFETYSKAFRIVAVRDTSVTITSWLEVEP